MKSSLGLFTLAIQLFGATAVLEVFEESRYLEEESNCTSIMEFVCDGDSEFETGILCEAIQMAGIHEEFEMDAWTLFAPTDEAFEAIPSDIVNSLMGEDMDDTRGLIDMLAFHSINGEVVESTDLICEGRLLMANEEFSVTICEGERVYQVGLGNPIMDYPEIIMADIRTCNGVIHIINKVMLFEVLAMSEAPSSPPSDGPSLTPSSAPSDGPSMEPSFDPSSSPSLQPSDGPSLEPSSAPSDGPSLEPSFDPSSSPSLQPSDGPSLEPSSAPSDGPSLEPSFEPSESPSATPTATPTGVPSAAPTRTPTACSIVDVACKSEGFSYLCGAITLAGLDGALSEYNSTFTVFAPNDAAFEKLGEAALSYLTDPENDDLLTKILAFHAVEDEAIYSDDLVCQELLEMSNGKDSRTVCRGGSVFQKGKGNSDEKRPQIIEADIETCNGIIHVVDEVMLYDYPEELGIPAVDATPAPTAKYKPTTSPYNIPPSPTAPSDCQTVDEIVCSHPTFSILCDNLGVAGISDALASGSWTLFAPSNAAFLKLPPGYVQSITSDEGVDDLSNLLLFHAVKDEILFKDDLPCVAGENLLTMANGKDSRTLCRDIRPGVPVPRFQKGKFNPRESAPAFVVTDIMACNGVVHEIDAVLLFEDIYS